MIYEEYFHDVWNEMPESLITEEYYSKNEEMFQAVTYDFYNYYRNGGNLPPAVASFAIQQMVSGLLSWGIR
jgi:hypothetical protein